MRVLCVLDVSEIPFAVTTTEFLSLWELHGEFVSVGPRGERVQNGKEETERPGTSLSCSIRNRIKNNVREIRRAEHTDPSGVWTPPPPPPPPPPFTQR